ncbi:hypothetical protein EDB83DRAFT_2315879 [Lactarius deliciosus]|nr:hypothetical protein EDB83DRAFT_2315879 [Lactarius deliciosus]
MTLVDDLGSEGWGGAIVVRGGVLVMWSSMDVQRVESKMSEPLQQGEAEDRNRGVGGFTKQGTVPLFCLIHAVTSLTSYDPHSTEGHTSMQRRRQRATSGTFFGAVVLTVFSLLWNIGDDPTVSDLRTTTCTEGQKADIKQLEQTVTMPQTVLTLSPGQVTILFSPLLLVTWLSQSPRSEQSISLSAESTAKLGRQWEGEQVASAHDCAGRVAGLVWGSLPLSPKPDLNQTRPQRGSGSA